MISLNVTQPLNVAIHTITQCSHRTMLLLFGLILVDALLCKQLYKPMTFLLIYSFSPLLFSIQERVKTEQR
jgi:hypothetical protein